MNCNCRSFAKLPSNPRSSARNAAPNMRTWLREALPGSVWRGTCQAQGTDRRHRVKPCAFRGGTLGSADFGENVLDDEFVSRFNATQAG